MVALALHDQRAREEHYDRAGAYYRIEQQKRQPRS
jgi:hypothetical protein